MTATGTGAEVRRLPPPEERAPRLPLVSESAPAAAVRFYRRNRHVTYPLSVPPALWGCAETAHALGWSGYVLTGAAVATVAAGATARNWQALTPHHKHATATAMGAGVWLSVASWLGPAGSLPASAILGGILVAGTVPWGIAWFRHTRVRGMKQRAKETAAWNSWWQRYARRWGVAGSGVTQVEHSGVLTRLTITGVRGEHHLATFAGLAPKIESALGGFVDGGKCRIAKVPRAPHKAYVLLPQHNPLREPVLWDPSLSPRSVHEHAAVGKTEAGQWCAVPQRMSAYILGKTRSGKSNLLLVRMLGRASCPDARTVLIDLKGGRSARPVLEAGNADYVIITLEEARDFLRFLTAEMQARQAGAYDGSEQLHATADTPAWFVTIDETYALTSEMAGDAECARLLGLLASQGAGVEIYAEVVTQYGALAESVRSEQTRSSLPLRVVFKMADNGHAQYAFPDHYHQVKASVLEEKGTCYLAADEELVPEQRRIIRAEHAEWVAFTQKALELRGDIGAAPLYCADAGRPGGDMTWGQWWAVRWSRLPGKFQAVSHQAQAGAGPRPAASRAAPSAPALVRAEPDRDSPHAVAARIEAESAALRDLLPDGFAPSPAIDTAPIVAAGKARFCAELQHPAGGTTSPRRLRRCSGMGETWVHGRLSELMDAGAVVKTGRGEYAAAPGADIAAALERIERVRTQRIEQVTTAGERHLRSVR